MVENAVYHIALDNFQNQGLDSGDRIRRANSFQCFPWVWGKLALNTPHGYVIAHVVRSDHNMETVRRQRVKHGDRSFGER